MSRNYFICAHSWNGSATGTVLVHDRICIRHAALEGRIIREQHTFKNYESFPYKLIGGTIKRLRIIM
jgi:hypothetical protein